MISDMINLKGSVNYTDMHVSCTEEFH